MRRSVLAGYTVGELEEIIEKFGSPGVANGFLRGEIVVAGPNGKWYEKDGIVHLTVISKGMTREEWIDFLKKDKLSLSYGAACILRSKDFEPTLGVFEIAIIKNKYCAFSDDWTLDAVSACAVKHQFSVADFEIACLIRQILTNCEIEAMGLHTIIAMHELAIGADGIPGRLCVDADGDCSWLCSTEDTPGRRYGKGYGFAFVKSKILIK